MKVGMSTRYRRARGFTLLEVLVATAILGTAVAALFGLLSGSLANARRLQAPEQALLLARSQLNELLAASEQGRAAEPVLPLDQTVRGRWDDRFRWEARASRVPGPREPNPGEVILVRIQLDAYWETDLRRGERKVSLETYQLWQQPRRQGQ